jgi:hypothetical protein
MSPKKLSMLSTQVLNLYYYNYYCKTCSLAHHFFYLGTVPVYLGDAKHLKLLLPHPKAAIFVADYNENYESLVNYLIYLTTNETAYEEHRYWRYNFNYEDHIKDKPLLQKSVRCRVCEWAVNTIREKPNISIHRNSNCSNPSLHVHKSLSDAYEGKLVKSNTREIFLIQNGSLHHIPNMDTFNALKFDLSKIIVIPDTEFRNFPKGHPLPEMQ